MEIEFGLRFSVQGDVIVASAAGEATLKVKLTYQPGIAPTGGDSGTSAGSGAGTGGEPRLSGPSWESPRILGEGTTVDVDPLAGGDGFEARVTARDPVHDLAVLHASRPLPRNVAGFAATDTVPSHEDVVVVAVP